MFTSVKDPMSSDDDTITLRRCKSNKFVFGDSSESESEEKPTKFDLELLDDSPETVETEFSYLKIQNSFAEDDENDQLENLKWVLPTVRNICPDTQPEVKREQLHDPENAVKTHPRKRKNCLQEKLQRKRMRIQRQRKRVAHRAKILFTDCTV